MKLPLHIVRSYESCAGRTDEPTVWDADDTLIAVFVGPDAIDDAREMCSAVNRTGDPVCAHCGKPAACFGNYEDQLFPAFACDECCGHGCEDGHCDQLAGAPMASEELSDRRLTAAEVARDILWRRDFIDPLASDADIDDIERYVDQQVADKMKPFLDDHARTLESGSELVADLRAIIATLERDLAAAREKLAESERERDQAQRDAVAYQDVYETAIELRQVIAIDVFKRVCGYAKALAERVSAQPGTAKDGGQ